MAHWRSDGSDGCVGKMSDTRKDTRRRSETGQCTLSQTLRNMQHYMKDLQAYDSNETRHVAKAEQLSEPTAVRFELTRVTPIDF